MQKDYNNMSLTELRKEFIAEDDNYAFSISYGDLHGANISSDNQVKIKDAINRQQDRQP